ncbi:hypothetical protein ACFVTC_29985 [Streptomyces sp. NPDC057950]|uniref:hypothetical protein n=1 Tax=Streptomyces sp. NPDC057950 TaxID=3346288 RepID=UPI0036F098CC
MDGLHAAVVNCPEKYPCHYDFTAYIAGNGGSNAWGDANAWADDTSWPVATPWA